MARQIKFRGKRADNGEWVYGYYARLSETEGYILNRNTDWFSTEKVDISSVGQFTGLTDCNEKPIYEGDIVVYGRQCKHVVEFKHGMFGYTLADGWFVGYGGNSNFTFNPLDKSKEHEVIGNKFDNPSLLK